MGLDIVSYSNLKKGKETEDSIYIGKGPSHVARHEYAEGWYEQTPLTEGHHFRAGSYSGYNEFRRHLCKAIHGVSCETFWANEDYKGTPFHEIIDFSDCEGVIGIEESKKLHAEFMLHYRIFKKYIEKVCGSEDAEYFMEKYDDWTKAFSISAQKGALILT